MEKKLFLTIKEWKESLRPLRKQKAAIQEYEESFHLLRDAFTKWDTWAQILAHLMDKGACRHRYVLVRYAFKNWNYGAHEQKSRHQLSFSLRISLGFRFASGSGSPYGSGSQGSFEPE